MSSDDVTSSTPDENFLPSDLGRVKWFNNRAGFCFVTVLQGEKKDEDIFVHHSGIVVNDGQYNVLFGRVCFLLFVRVIILSILIRRGVRGVEGGWLMCETRNANCSSRSEEDGGEDDGERRPRRR